MSDELKDAKGIFLAALDIQDSAERVAFVERSCGGDAALKRRVDDLLRAYGKPDGPLDELAAAWASTDMAEPIREQVGAAIGPYKLMEQIGEGGFGLVFVAEQRQPIRRQVALKIVKPGMDTRDVIARFEAERQALALMDHPNIAKVLDAGTTQSGRPYFVMELVRGVPITDYCDKHQLTPRERLEVFVPVCNAIQHAHLKGIIHRDIKPSNVLVTLHDGKPVVKVIDFGVAKALHQPLTDRTIYTRFAQMIGTPLYMSPEQAQMSGLDIDTRSDIYSLGVLFYELLTGTTPFDKRRLAKAAYDELLRIIREEEPPKPSMRLSQSTDSLPSIAAQRKTEPAKLSKMFHGDLDWIAMKALEKDRSRRYETANAFAADVFRYLNDEPVEASPPSASYRLRKFVGKHRKPVIVMAAIAVVLLIGIAGTTWGLFRARRARQAAETAERAARQSENKAVDALNAKEKALTAETVQRDRAERQFINGLLRPIGFSDRTDPAELHSFVDWSAIEDSSLKSRVLEIAFENPETALRLARRTERVIQACVGLSSIRRAQAIKLVSAKQRDMAADPRIRIAAYWLALELGSADLSEWAETCNYLSEPKNQAIDQFGDFVKFAVSRSDPQQIAQLNPDVLIAILETSTNDNAQQALCDAVPQLAPRLEAAQVKRAGDALIAVLGKSTDSHVLSSASGGLQSLAPRLEPAQAMRACDSLIANAGLWNTFSADALLKALALRLEPVPLKRAADAWIAMLERSRSTDVNTVYAWKILGVAALAPRLEQPQFKRIADALIGFLERSNDSVLLAWAIEGLRTLAPRLEPAQVKRAADDLIAILQKSADIWPFNKALDVLREMAPRLEPAQAKRAWEEVNTNLRIDSWADSVLAPLAPRLNPAQAKRAGDGLIAILEKSADNRMLDLAAGRVVALAPCLEPGQVKRAADALIAILEKSTDYNVRFAADAGLSALARRLEAAQVRRTADVVIANLEKFVVIANLEKVYSSPGLDVLKELPPRLEPGQLSRFGDALIAILEKSGDNDVLAGASIGLQALAPRLEPAQTKRSWDAVIAAVGNLKGAGQNNRALIALARAGAALAALAPRLEPASPDNRSTTATAIVLDYCSSFDLNSMGPKEVASSMVVARSISSARSLAKLLSHPACVAEQREILLTRFEELVFHDGKPLFSEQDATEAKKPGAAHLPPRRFHNLHDAAAWIQQNWPDFDLEATYPATWHRSR